jgi:hypothetical protein
MKSIFRTVFLFLAMGFTAARAVDKVEVGLYLAENEPPPALSHVAGPELQDRLFQVFGFRHYQLLKKDRIVFKNAEPQWFIPRRDFFICLKPAAPEADEPELVDYEIFQQGFIVAKGKYEPSEGTPLFINGPEFRNGRLIFVLETR